MDLPGASKSTATSLPLHVQNPPVKTLSWEQADKVVVEASKANPTLLKVWSVATAPYRHDDVASELAKAAENRPARQRFVSKHDREVLLDAKFIVRAPHSVPPTTAINFVDELEKHRRRTITWPEMQNEVERVIASMLDYKSLFFHPSTIRENGRYPFAALADFTKFFQQFEFETNRFWPVRLGDEPFYLRTIPTGSVLSPILAQTLLCSIAVAAIAGDAKVEFDAMIDNVRFVSKDRRALKRVWYRFLGTCARVGITVGDKTLPTGDAYDHLGTHVTVDRHVRLTVKVARKLIASTAKVTEGGEVVWRDIQSAFGRLVYALTTVGISLGRAYFVLKFIRRRSRKQLDQSGLTTVWQRARDDWRRLVADALTSRYVFEANPTMSCALYTDASEDGWGVVVFGLTSAYTVFGAKWQDKELGNRIDRLEFQALKIGLRWIAKVKPEGRLEVHVFVDNTTVKFIVRSGFSRKYTLNDAGQACKSICDSGDIVMNGPHWVPTKHNYADHPSRIFAPRVAKARVREQLRGNWRPPVTRR